VLKTNPSPILFLFLFLLLFLIVFDAAHITHQPCLAPAINNPTVIITLSADRVLDCSRILQYLHHRQKSLNFYVHYYQFTNCPHVFRFPSRFCTCNHSSLLAILFIPPLHRCANVMKPHILAMKVGMAPGQRCEENLERNALAVC
jgi:hypothetical protein